MATHLSLPKVSVTSTDSGDSGFESKNQSKLNIIEERLNPPQSLHLLSPHDNVQEPHRVRKSSTGSNTSSSYSSDTSSPGSTRPLLSDRSTPKSKKQDLSQKGNESSQKQAAVQQKSKSSEMTDTDEITLRDTICYGMPTFVKHTDFKMLYSHLCSRKLLHLGEYEILTNMPSNTDKGNHLYMHILPHKGEHAYRQFYECLENETEHKGHRDLVVILNEALKDTPRCNTSTDSSPTENDQHPSELNYTETVLRETVRREMPTFVHHTDYRTLYSHLYSRELLHSSDYETLMSMLTDQERGTHLYMKILPSKGTHTYRRLYECLKNEKEHRGHRDLVKLLSKALRNRPPPQSSSPTEGDKPGKRTYLHTHSQAKLCCCIQ